MAKGSFNIFRLIGLVLTAGGTAIAQAYGGVGIAVAVLFVGFLLSLSPRMLNEWEHGVLLRLGKFRKVVKPGIVWLIPGFDTLAARVDMRVRSTPFSAEKTLTEDTVPINVDAVMFWVVTDAKKAVLEVEDYLETIAWAAQTTLRDVIGRSELIAMISDREELDRILQETIDAKTHDWGITVQSVEIRDMVIPSELEDAMSRKAQADREREARVILAQSEQRVAEIMESAAETYQENPVALQLRAMNMTYESIKEKGALMVVPSTMNGSMDPGIVGLASSAFRVENGGAG